MPKAIYVFMMKYLLCCCALHRSLISSAFIYNSRAQRKISTACIKYISSQMVLIAVSFFSAKKKKTLNICQCTEANSLSSFEPIAIHSRYYQANIFLQGHSFLGQIKKIIQNIWLIIQNRLGNNFLITANLAFQWYNMYCIQKSFDIC